MLFESFSKGPGGFPMYSSSQVRSPHWNQYYGLTFVDHGVFSLGETKRFLIVLLPSKGLYIIPPTYLFDTFAETLV